MSQPTTSAHLDGFTENEAALIASAPELLAACREAEEFLKPMHEHDCSGCTVEELDAVMASLWAAIARATFSTVG